MMKKQRIIALILSVVLILLSIPFSRIESKAEVIPADTKINIVVSDLSGNAIADNISFYVKGNEDELTAEYVEATEKYEVNVGSLEADDLVLTVKLQDEANNISMEKDITYVPEQTEDYSVTMYEYVNPNLQDASFNETNFTYSHTIEYTKDGITFNNVSLSNITGSGVSWNADSSTLYFTELGNITADLEYAGDYDAYDIYKAAKLKITVVSDIKFLMSNNISGTDVDVTPDTDNNDLVGTVTLKNAKNTYKANISAKYLNDLKYEVVDATDSSKISVDTFGGVTLKSNELKGSNDFTAKIKAYYQTNPNISATYDIVFKPIEEEITLNLWNNYEGSFGVGNSFSHAYWRDYDFIVGLPEIYGVSYNITSSKTSVVKVATNWEGYTVLRINGSGSAVITITPTNSDGAWKKYKVKTFTYSVGKASPSVDLYYDNDKIDSEYVISVDDTEANEDDKILIPVRIDVYAPEDTERTGDLLDATFKHESTILEFVKSEDNKSYEGYIVLENVDNIERNVSFPYVIDVIATSSNYNNAQITTNICINGVPTNNSSIYTYKYVDGDAEKPLVTGKDGHKWALSKNVRFTVVNANDRLSKDQYSDLLTSLTIVAAGTEVWNKEHKLFYSKYKGIDPDLELPIYDDPISAREYYGTDLSVPTIIASGTKIVNESDISGFAGSYFTNKDIKVYVKAQDTDKHLYSVALFNGTAMISEKAVVSTDNNATGYYEFTLPIATYAGQTLSLKAVAYDAAGRKSTEYAIKTITFDSTAPTVTIEPVEADADTADIEANEEVMHYVSDDVDIKFTAEDMETGASGVNHISIEVNGQPYPQSIMAEEVVNSLVKDLAILENVNPDNGKYVIKAIAYDNAGNPSEPFTYVIYKDVTPPEEAFLSIEGTGVNYEYGNFYKTETTIKLNVSDDGAGLKSSVLQIGDTSIEGTIEAGVATFVIPLGTYGNVEITTTDMVEHSVTKTLTELDSTFKSNLLIVESDEPVVSVSPSSQAINGKWYNDTVVFGIKAKEDGEEGEAAGIHSVKFYVNDVEYGTEVIYDNLSTFEPDTYIVTVDESIVNEELYKDGKYVVKAVVTDNAGNVGTNEATVYVDLEKPTAKLSSVKTTGANNVTAYGNFYNKNVMLTLDVYDTISGVKEAFMNIGDKKYTGTIKNGKITFTAPINVTGKVSFTVIDNATNPQVFRLAGIERVEDVANFTNDLIITEAILPEISITEQKAANANGWYNSELKVDVAVVEKELSSGIANVKTYINDTLYEEKSYSNATTKSGKYLVSINDAWINSVINANGTYTVKVVVTDNAGNVAEKTKDFKIDLVAPVIGNITGVVEGSNNAGTVVINIPVTEKHFAEKGNTTVINVTKELDGVVIESTINTYAPTVIDNIQSFSFTEDGTYNITVESTDAAGNKAESQSISFILDNTDPIVSISGVTEGSYVQDSATVEFGVIESNYKDDVVTIEASKTLNGNKEAVNIDNFNSSAKTSTLNQTFTAEGYYELTISATDASGNVAKVQTLHFTVDTSAPEIIIEGLTDKTSYQEEVEANITINDNYFAEYSVILTQSAVVNDAEKTKPIIINDENVTAKFLSGINKTDISLTDKIAIPKEQLNDGLYELTVTAKDHAGRITTKSIAFTVNSFGSVFVLDDEFIKFLATPYVQKFDGTAKITEYNATEVLSENVSVIISRDGAPISNPDFKFTEVKGPSNWHQYEYEINASNFETDGIYKVSVATMDSDGNTSETIKDDRLAAVFSVDTTKPELVAVTGLSSKNINASSIAVDYEVFDAIGIKSVAVYVDGNIVNEVNDIDSLTQYLGNFNVGEGMNQHIRLVITDLAGNVTDTDNGDDSKYVAKFNKTVTVSTNFFIRWYANKAAFFGSIAGLLVVVAGVITIIVVGKKKKAK